MGGRKIELQLVGSKLDRIARVISGTVTEETIAVEIVYVKFESERAMGAKPLRHLDKTLKERMNVVGFYPMAQ